MSTLSTLFSKTSDATAIIIPSEPDALTISYKKLADDISSVKSRLADIGISHGAAVSISLPNSYAFIVAFLATSYQRTIAAPLNSAYKQDEFEFYIDDLSSSLTLIPQGAYVEDGPAVRAPRKYKAAVAERYWDGEEIVRNITHLGKLKDKNPGDTSQAKPDDV